MKRIILLLTLLTGLPILAACSPGNAAETAPSQTITLAATDIAFDVERIEVKAGQTIQLTLDNQGVLEHDFNITEIPLSGETTVTEAAGAMPGHDMGYDMGQEMGHAADEPAVHVAAPGGDRAAIEFVPTSPGEYEFYCTVSGHREAGMHGVLVVK